MAAAALGESQDEVGVLGGSVASDFWFGKGARGPLLASLIDLLKVVNPGHTQSEELLGG